MNLVTRFCLCCDSPRPRPSKRGEVHRCACGCEYRARRRWLGRRVEWIPTRRATTSRDDSVLESRVPDLNPWSGAAVVALHSHTMDEPCDERCSVHERHADSDTP